MNTVEIFSILENFGAEIFLCAFAVCAACFFLRKLFPRIPFKAETAVRSVLSVAFCAMVVVAKTGDFSSLFERSTTVFGVSFAICSIFRGEKQADAVSELVSLFVPESEKAAAMEKIEKCETAEEIGATLTEFAGGVPEDTVKVFSETIFVCLSERSARKTL